MTRLRLNYTEFDGAYQDINYKRLEEFAAKDSPANCPICPLREAKNESCEVRSTRNGLTWNGVDYHAGDFVFIRQALGVCTVAQIREFSADKQSDGMKVRVIYLYRIADLMPGYDEVRVLRIDIAACKVLS